MADIYRVTWITPNGRRHYVDVSTETEARLLVSDMRPVMRYAAYALISDTGIRYDHDEPLVDPYSYTGVRPWGGWKTGRKVRRFRR